MREMIEVYVSSLYKNSSNGQWNGTVSTMQPAPVEGKKVYLYKLNIPKELVAEFAEIVEPEDDKNEKADGEEKTDSEG